MKKVLFICTGNYYRSKFAEIYFNKKCMDHHLPYKAFSRGFDISNKSNIGLISKFAEGKLKKLNIKLPRNLKSPRLVKTTDLLKSDIVIALNENEHRPLVKKYFPQFEFKFSFWNIKDLYLEDPETSLIKLINEVEDLVELFCKMEY